MIEIRLDMSQAAFDLPSYCINAKALARQSTKIKFEKLNSSNLTAVSFDNLNA